VEAPALVTEHPDKRQYCQDRDHDGRYFPEIFHDAKHTHTELFVPRALSSGTRVRTGPPLLAPHALSDVMYPIDFLCEGIE
jgi:hypothetical protein